MIPPLSLVAVIGFESDVYDVVEDTGFVEVTIGVLEGELDESVSVGFSTQDGTAIGIMFVFINALEVNHYLGLVSFDTLTGQVVRPVQFWPDQYFGKKGHVHASMNNSAEYCFCS